MKEAGGEEADDAGGGGDEDDEGVVQTAALSSSVSVLSIFVFRGSDSEASLVCSKKGASTHHLECRIG